MSKAVVSEGYKTNSIVVISALALLSGVAFFFFALSPALIDRLRQLASTTDRTTTILLWLLPIVAAGIACGGAALGVLTFARLIRELEQNIFGWLAPSLAIFSAFMISGVPFELPGSAVNRMHFAVLSSLLFVGGGAVILVPRWSYKVLGIAMSVFPLEVLVLGYALQYGGIRQAWIAANNNELYVLFMLTETCAIILFIAFVAARTRKPEGPRVETDSQIDYYDDPTTTKYQWAISECLRDEYALQKHQRPEGSNRYRYARSAHCYPVQSRDAVQNQSINSRELDDARMIRALKRKPVFPFIV
jgi:hypothetical protein